MEVIMKLSIADLFPKIEAEVPAIVRAQTVCLFAFDEAIC